MRREKQDEIKKHMKLIKKRKEYGRVYRDLAVNDCRTGIHLKYTSIMDVNLWE